MIMNATYENEIDQCVDKMDEMSKRMDKETIVSELFETELPSMEKGEYKRAILSFLFDQRIGFKAVSTAPEAIQMGNLKKVLSKVENPSERKLLFCLYCYEALNYHESGWIKMDWAKVLSVLYTKKEISIFNKSIIGRCAKYGVEMRVVGSKNPIICYSLKFFDICADGEEVKTKDLKKWFKENCG